MTAMNPAELDQLVPEAMRDQQEWERLLTRCSVEEIRASLTRLRFDLKQQRSINNASMVSGHITHREYNEWLTRSKGFERAVIRRLTELQVNLSNPAGGRTLEQSRNYYRKRHKADVVLIENLALAIHKYLEEEGDEELLEDALDLVADFGKLGEMTLAEAIETGDIPSRKSVEKSE